MLAFESSEVKFIAIIELHMLLGVLFVKTEQVSLKSVWYQVATTAQMGSKYTDSF